MVGIILLWIHLIWVNLCWCINMAEWKLANNLNLGLLGQYDGISVVDKNSPLALQYNTSVVLENYPQGYLKSIYLLNNNNNNISLLTTNIIGSVYDSCSLNEYFYIAGNLSTINDIPVTPLTRINKQTGEISSLISKSDSSFPIGIINSILCINQSVYVAGNFNFNGSYGSAIWNTSSNNWFSSPFGSFNNGSTISKISYLSNSNNILYTGNFNSISYNYSLLNDTTISPTYQYVSLNLANVSSNGSNDQSYSSPASLLCGLNSSITLPTWKLLDNTLGSWSADLPMAVYPTVLQLRNADSNSFGTQTFRVITHPNYGIMPMTYTNSTTGETQYCDTYCPLNIGAQQLQSFHFLTPLYMTGFTIQIMSYYGDAAGLSAVGLLDEESRVYAFDRYNQVPACAGIPEPSVPSSIVNGNYYLSNASALNSYIVANISSPSDILEHSVFLYPNISLSRKYDIHLYTPGCEEQGTCSRRGVVRVDVVPSPGKNYSSLIYQNNFYLKYDRVYSGHIENVTDTFRPYIAISPLSGNSLPLEFVVDHAELLTNSTQGGFTTGQLNLNGIFEYNPLLNNTYLTNSSYINSTLTSVGQYLGSNARTYDVAIDSNQVYLAGNYPNSDYGNTLVAVNKNNFSLQSIGTNNWTGSIYQLLLLNDSTLFASGNFTSAQNNYFAWYNIPNSQWSSQSSLINNVVSSMSQLLIKDDNNNFYPALSLYGTFTEVSNGENNFNVDRSATFLPTQLVWYEDKQALLALSLEYIDGVIYSSTNIGNNSYMIFASDLYQQSLYSLNGLSILDSSLNINNLITKSFLNSSAVINTGILFQNNNFSSFAFGGSFNFTLDDNSNREVINLAIFRNGNYLNGPVGLARNSTFLATNAINSTLYAGGSVTGNIESNQINGLIAWDYVDDRSPNNQPPPLSGDRVTVMTLANYPGSSNLYVGGLFESAGSLSCPALCIYDVNTSTWVKPGGSIDGYVTDMIFDENGILYFSDQYNGVPGPAVSMAFNYSRSSEGFYVSGIHSTNLSTYLVYYDGENWHDILSSILSPLSAISNIEMINITNTVQKKTTSLEVLLVMGTLLFENGSSVSAAIYDGFSWSPFLSTSRKDNSYPGLISGTFSQPTPQIVSLNRGKRFMDRGFIVLIGLALSVAVMGLMTLGALAASRLRRRLEGYTPASQSAPIFLPNLSGPANLNNPKTPPINNQPGMI